MSAEEIALIHGPPGTRKPHTIVEIIWQLAKQGKRLLVCGASTISVDNLAMQISDIPKNQVVCLGNSARIMPAALKHSLHWKEKHMIESDLVAKPGLLVKAAKRTASRKIVKASIVVLSTLSGAADKDPDKMSGKFDVVIIDEARQVVEGECWIAAIRAPKLILAGDHRQLPPTVKSLGKKDKQQ
ncbi:AAA domain-containing protein [Coemansia spiralis]|nr:AAA domain-containing protein [Coemansia spiralis]